jgi:hypothetical protein
MLIIISSTVILATDKHTVDCVAPSVADGLNVHTHETELDFQICYDLIEHTNDYFTALFALECILKLTGLTFDEWKSDFFNMCDLFIVLTSMYELMIQH